MESPDRGRGEGKEDSISSFVLGPAREVLMEIEGIEKELSEAGCLTDTKEDLDITLEELMGEIEETLRKMDTNLKRRTKRQRKKVQDILRQQRGGGAEPRKGGEPKHLMI
jgi:hypothetical protein